MHRFLHENLKNEIDQPAIKSELLHLANSYNHNYKPSRSIVQIKTWNFEKYKER